MHWTHYTALCRPNPSKSIAQILLPHYFVWKTANFPRCPWLFCSCSLFCPECTTMNKIYFLTSKSSVILIVVSILIPLNTFFFFLTVDSSYIYALCLLLIYDVWVLSLHFSQLNYSYDTVKACHYMMWLYDMMRLSDILFFAYLI